MKLSSLLHCLFAPIRLSIVALWIGARNNLRSALFIISATVFMVAPSAGTSKSASPDKTATKKVSSVQRSAPSTPKVVTSSPDYVVTTSTGASIVPGATDIGNHCDDCGTGITLPFPVKFYDQTFTTATVYSNGNLYFTSGETCCTVCVPNSSANNLISPSWTDLYTADAGSGQGIFTSVSGTAPNRIFNIEWRTQHCCSGGPPTYNFEVRLYEGQNRIDFIYGACAGGFGGIGLQRDTGSQSTIVSSCGNTPAPGTQYTFIPCVIPPADMFGWWPGEGNLNDIQGGYNGTGAGGGPAFEAGKVGQAMSFDGTNDTVTVSGFPDPNPAYSVDAWVYWKGVINGSQHDAILVKTQNSDGSGGDSYGLFIYAGDNSLLSIIAGDTVTVNTPPGSVPLNEWFHVAQTYDGTTLKVFINGQLEASTSASRSVSTGLLAFGTRSGVQHFIHGLLDEIEIFSRALSSNEINAIYNAGTVGKCKAAPATLWYNGDFDGANGLRNEQSSSASSSVYDDFIVPASDDLWVATAIFSNNLSNATITGANWSIRSGMSAGNGGTIVASGSNSPVTVTPTGGSGFGLSEYRVTVSGLNIGLAPGTYWLNVTPVSATPASYDGTTSGANAVGQPPGNDGNSFWDSSTFSANFSPQSDDFSMGVIGTVCQKSTFYRDADGDGFGDPNVTISSCFTPAGYVSNNTDCDDTNANVHPGATEVCDGIDNDCNGQIDDGLPTSTFYRDADGDGYGDPNVTTQACSAPAGYVADNTDCNDADAAIHPGATELCNGIDDNCDGQIDEGVKTTFYRDADGDGYGDPNVTSQACSAPAGYVADNTDCNDSNAAIHPGATELCNGIDDNCNGQVDEGNIGPTWYRDADGDGYGNPNVTIQACSAPAGYVSNNTDCNDSNAAVHPGATEVCNGIDDNCNGQIDEGNIGPIWYRDADGDGYGNPAVTTHACNQPAGYVANNTDCNDSNASVHPGATEVCNGIDDNCNGLVDERCTAHTPTPTPTPAPTPTPTPTVTPTPTPTVTPTPTPTVTPTPTPTVTPTPTPIHRRTPTPAPNRAPI